LALTVEYDQLSDYLRDHEYLTSRDFFDIVEREVALLLPSHERSVPPIAARLRWVRLDKNILVES
jgi:hypothetical protein